MSMKAGWYAERSEMNSDRSIGYETQEYFIDSDPSRDGVDDYCRRACLGTPYWLDENGQQTDPPEDDN